MMKSKTKVPTRVEHYLIVGILYARGSWGMSMEVKRLGEIMAELGHPVVYLKAKLRYMQSMRSIELNATDNTVKLYKDAGGMR